MCICTLINVYLLFLESNHLYIYLLFCPLISWRFDCFVTARLIADVPSFSRRLLLRYPCGFLRPSAESRLVCQIEKISDKMWNTQRIKRYWRRSVGAPKQRNRCEGDYISSCSDLSPVFEIIFYTTQSI